MACGGHRVELIRMVRLSVIAECIEIAMQSLVRSRRQGQFRVAKAAAERLRLAEVLLALPGSDTTVWEFGTRRNRQGEIGTGTGLAPP